MISTNRINLGHSTSTLNTYNDDEEEFASLEPFFFDEAEAVHEHERQMRILQEEERRKEQRDRDLKVHRAAWIGSENMIPSWGPPTLPAYTS
jgi:hypothetical protein